MTKQDKELLIKDLCARLPYGVKIYVRYYDISNDDKLKTMTTLLCATNLEFCIEPSHWVDVKPYLRPMENMTKKEEKEYSKFAHFGNTLGDWTKSIDYLNAHHFDYRGLIPMGLALPATEGMYNFK